MNAYKYHSVVKDNGTIVEQHRDTSHIFLAAERKQGVAQSSLKSTYLRYSWREVILSWKMILYKDSGKIK